MNRVSGSINVGLNGRYAEFAGSVVPPDVDIVLIVEQGVAAQGGRSYRHWVAVVQRIADLLQVVSPFSFEPQVPRERCYLYAGLVDRLASPEHALELWEHWGRPRMSWYNGSHISFLWENDVKKLLQEALQERGFLPETPTG